MTHPLAHISDEELEKDLAENERDIELCKEALAVGIKTYSNGESIEYWVEVGLSVSKTIRAEIDRRKLES